jgi:hypothetical protein
VEGCTNVFGSLALAMIPMLHRIGPRAAPTRFAIIIYTYIFVVCWQIRCRHGHADTIFGGRGCRNSVGSMLNCLQGECLLSLHTPDEAAAEAAFARAIEVARGQSAKMWELRAASSLARLWRDQGKQTDARDVLAPVYTWFTEGLNTPDLREAATVLAELRR